MVEIRKNQGEVILTREQLQELECLQAEFAELMGRMRESVEEFGNVLLRHYFNRENGFLDLQQQNLREIDQLQAILGEMAGKLGQGAAELDSFLKQAVKGKNGRAGGEDKTGPKSEKAGTIGTMAKPTGPDSTTVPKGPRRSLLIGNHRTKLKDASVKGGEISIKLFFEELGLLRPERREVLKEITRQLHDFLYERKLVGYSKTSLVFGRDRSLEQVLESLETLFLSDIIKNLLVEEILVEPGAELRLGCTIERELVYIVSEEAGH